MGRGKFGVTMRFGEIGNLAWDSLRVNRVRSFLTALGIIIGVLSIVILTSIALGVRSQVLGEMEKVGPNTFAVFPGNIEASHGAPGSMVVNRLTYEHVRLVQENSHYSVLAAPEMVSITPVKFGNKTSNTTYVVGTSPDYAEIARWGIARGSFIRPGDVQGARKVCVVGTSLVKNILKGLEPMGKSLSIRGSKFKIIGVMESKGYMFNMDIDDIVFVPVTTAENLFGMTNITEIAIRVPNPADLEAAMAETRKILLRDLDPEDFSLKSQSEFMDMLNTITGILTAALAAIAGISLIVGGIGIMNIMLVSVRERTREIGLRKAVGATEGDILIQFLTESIALSLAGGVVGILASYGLAYLITSLTPIDVWVQASAIMMALGFCCLVGVFFGVYPAIKAARLDPIVALRYE
jgi:putative ABC transport system permease protein